ncbi:MAG: beta-ketoacyl-[acyl-carrier-protein] synthase family protein [Candidatus Omnitrophica bacterium]|nr:beta-ketoacyl-[acyl-carrier-protein] synthase family protein [Candidatus Omnitrophota bacterium]
MKRRVVVTGMGAVTPIGIGIPDLTKGLQEGVSGNAQITSFDVAQFPVKQACQVKNFDARVFHVQGLDPFIQYAIAGATEAVGDARFECSKTDPYRIGISVSSSKGGVHTIDRFKERFQKHPSPILGARIYANSVPNFASQWIARRWKIQGPAKCYVAACATGTVAVIEGARMVREGIVDFCLAGASDASIVPLMLAGYHRMKVLSPDAIRPFDKHRKGFVIGEGAGIVFLETLESARARGAKIYGEILGYSYGQDCFDGIRFDPHVGALARTLKQLMKETGLAPNDIDYINLHGTGTQSGDLYETNQIKAAFGQHAYHIPMSSTKSMTGHMLGATGAVEIIASFIAMREQWIPPTINLETKDNACDLDYTPLKVRKADIQAAISISMGFGGHVATIALKNV